jgi:V/A-type H+-transporting ATPase subunit I
VAILSPAKIEIIKITTRTSVERKVIRALHDHTDIELIDVEKKGLGSGAKSESELDHEVTSLLSSFSSMVESLKLPRTIKKTTAHNLDKESLEETLAYCKKIFDEINPDVSKVTSKISQINRENSDLELLLETTKILNPLKIKYNDLGEGKYFTVFTGQILSERVERLQWNLKELTDDSIIFSSAKIPEEKNYTAVVIGAFHRYKEDISRILGSMGFVELNVSKPMDGTPEEIEAASRRNLLENSDTLADLDNQRANLASKHGEHLLAIKEQLEIERERIEAKKLMRSTTFVLQVWGFIPKSQVHNVESIVKSMDTEAMVEIEHDVKFTDDDYPTKLENGKMVKPYEGLVQAYGIPAYKKDYDPSLLFALTFPILFGIMFADIFHGILLIILGFYSMKLQPLGRAPETMKEELMDYLQKGGLILFISGISSTVFGYLFNSFAGLHGEHAPFFMQGLPYLWSNSSHAYELFGNASGTFLFLQLSLVIGIIHITAALTLLFIKKVQKKHYKEAILFPGMLLGGYISAVLLVFSYGLNFFQWPSSEPAPFDIAVLKPILGYGETALFKVPGLTVFLVMIVFFGIFFFYETFSHGMDGVSEALDFTLSLLGNSVSYARLFAINIVHSILSLIAYSALSLPERLPFVEALFGGSSAGEAAVAVAEGSGQAVTFDLFTEILILIAFIVGTVVVMSLELMITFLQALRLHLVEFFSKLHFAGSGRKFSSFRARRLLTEPVRLTEGA